MHLLVLSNAPDGGKAVLPALEFLDHTLALVPLSPEAFAPAAATPSSSAQADLIIIDGTTNLAAASQTCRSAAASDINCPILAVVNDGGLAALKASWGFDDWVVPRAQPAEVETRMRLVVERHHAIRRSRAASVGELSIDEDTYIVRLSGRPLDLTYREFELLKYLANNPARVFTRGQLLQEVWGYDYYGGTRTVDVHIRRLRAKLGAEYEALIGTVRGVGYKLDPHGATRVEE